MNIKYLAIFLGASISACSNENTIETTVNTSTNTSKNHHIVVTQNSSMSVASLVNLSEISCVTEFLNDTYTNVTIISNTSYSFNHSNKTVLLEVLENAVSASINNTVISIDNVMIDSKDTHEPVNQVSLVMGTIFPLLDYCGWERIDN